MLRDVRSAGAAAGAAGARGHRPARGRVPAAALPRGGRQDLPDFHRRSHRGRHDQPRPDGGAVAGAGGRCRRHDLRLLRPHRRSHGHGRAHAGGGARCARVWAAGGGRGADQHSRGRHRLAVEREAVGQLDGGLRRARRRRRAVRHGAHRGRGAVSRARHRHSGGQGLAVHEDGVGRGRVAQVGGRAGVADRLGVRAGGRCAQDLDAAAAHRSRRDDAAARRSRRAARTASAARRWRRCMARWARRRRISTIPNY